MAFILVGLTDIVNDLRIKIDIYDINRGNQIYDLFDLLKETTESTIRNEKGLIEIAKYIQELERNLNKTTERFKQVKHLDVKDIEKLKEANLVVYNANELRAGSGTHIKIKGNSYILSVAHLVKDKTNEIYGITDDGTFRPLELEKIDKDKDLALFKIRGVENTAYLEISEESPQAGSEIVVIGNPASLEDVITDGIIAKITKEGYIFTNTIFFGNSGGAVLYKGKIIGVASQLRTYINFPVVFVNFGYSSNLESIQNFLKYIKPYDK
jgi:S1-C subfamily serine protease